MIIKNYLLITGDNYYPQSGTENWIGCFSTFDEAESVVLKTQTHELFLKGPRKGQIKSTSETYKINGRNYDWYEVVNLMDWISKE